MAVGVGAALCRRSGGLNDCVHHKIRGHKLFVSSVLIMDKLGCVEQAMLP